MTRFIARASRMLRVPTTRRPIWTEFLFRFYGWASREIHPLHPDAGHVCITHNELRHAQRKGGR